MSDARIDQLTETKVVQSADLFVLSQSGQAKRLSGEYLLRNLTTALAAHGGIANVSYTPPSWAPSPPSQALAGDLVITLVDNSSELIKLYNGRGIANITDTTSGTSGNGQYHDLTITYNDGTTSTLRLRDGVKGDQGIQTTVYIKWSEDYPQSSADLLDSPTDNTPWIGIFVSPWGVSVPSAPTDPTEYSWYNYKGAKGDAGASIDYISGPSTTPGSLVDTYTINMTDGNTHNFDVTNGNGIVSITRTGATPATGSTDAGKNVTYTINFTNGNQTTFTVYNGADGSGSVSTVSGIQPTNGDVAQVFSGNGAPTTSTQGTVNQFYWDENNGKLYLCLGESGGSYIWNDVAAGLTIDSAFDTTSENPVQNKVIANKVGMGALNTTAQNLVGAINEVKAGIPSASSVTPLVDSGSGVIGNGTAWARSNHQHPLNVPTSGVPAALGTASLGSATTYAKSDHVHAKPTPSDIGAVATTALLDLIYPVGCYYWTSNNTHGPWELGGTWNQVEDVFMLAAGTSYSVGDGETKDGGEPSVTLGMEHMPSHRHATYYQEWAQNYSSGTARRTISSAGTSSADEIVAGTSYAGGVGSGRNTQGTTSAHNNMPPYVVAYCWHRTA